MSRTRLRSVGLLALGLFCFVAATLVNRMLAGDATADRPGHPTEPSSVSAEGAAPSELGEQWPERVVSYRLDASLDPSSHEIEGTGTIELHNVSAAPLGELYVHLYLNAFENDSTVFMRRKGSGFRGQAGLRRNGSIDVKRFFVREMDAEVWPDRPTTEGDPNDRTDIRVPLPRPIAPGESVHVDVSFVSKLPSVFLRTGAEGSFHMAGQWFPKLAKLEPDGRWAHFPFQRFSEFYANYGDYDVTLSTPPGFVVGATGEEVSRTVSDRQVLHYVAKSVHDFAFVAWDGFEEKRATAGSVRVRCLYPPGYEGDAEREIEAATAGLEFLGGHYGAYPYSTLTIVHPPAEAGEAGGMEYPTLITTGGPWWLSTSSSRVVELLTLHELAHQWFYGLVATNENAHPFLDEGITTYVSGEAATAIYGDHPITSVYAASIAAGERINAKGVAEHAAIASPADGFPTGRDYARLVYYRTSTLLHTLDRVYDGAGRRAVARYAREHRFGHPGPDDLLRAIEQEGGSEAREVARVALFERASVDFRIDPLPRGSREVTVRRDGALVVPVDIDLFDEEDRRTRVTWDGAAPSATLSTPVPVRRALIDPEVRILLDEDLLDDGGGVGWVFPPRVAALAWIGSQALLGTVLE